MENLLTIPNYTPLAFQKDAIIKGIDMLSKTDGLLIFDETGLGKTIESLTIALNNGCKNLFIATPAKNKNNWLNVLKGFDVKYRIATHSKIPTVGDYDLVIVDESHNFKKETSKGFQNLFKLIHLNKIPSILLTATPFQNNWKEFRCMLSLMRLNPNSVANCFLGVVIDTIIKDESKLLKLVKYNQKCSNAKAMDEIKASLSLNKQIRKLAKVLNHFSVYNTRIGIKEKYSADLVTMGSFPTVTYNDIEVGVQFPIGDTINILKKSTFASQNSITYYTSDNDKLDLKGIMTSLVFKRLDSSVAAFKKTINNFINKIDTLLSVGTIQIDTKKIVTLSDAHLTDLKADRELYVSLLALWKDYNDNAKLDKLFECLEKKGKTLIFTEYNATLDLIAEAFKKRSKKRFIVINANSDKKQLDVLEANFDANLATCDDYDTIIATDVISEGVSLHLCDNVVLFDSKWNPSKNIQRIGRIDRITKGKQNPKSVYTFITDSIIEDKLKLQSALTRKSSYADKLLTELLKGKKVENRISDVDFDNTTKINERLEYNPKAPQQYSEGDIVKTNEGYYLINGSLKYHFVNKSNNLAKPIELTKYHSIRSYDKISDYPSRTRLVSPGFRIMGSMLYSRAFNILWNELNYEGNADNLKGWLRLKIPNHALYVPAYDEPKTYTLLVVKK